MGGGNGERPTLGRPPPTPMGPAAAARPAASVVAGRGDVAAAAAGSGGAGNAGAEDRDTRGRAGGGTPSKRPAGGSAGATDRPGADPPDGRPAGRAADAMSAVPAAAAHTREAATPSSPPAPHPRSLG